MFIEMHFHSTLAAPNCDKPYRALYLIGCDEEGQAFVLHLSDTSCATRDHLCGFGKRKGEAVSFVFNCATAPFKNPFTLDSQHLLIKTCATMQLTRK